ncbi:MAG: protein kinase domain-containing protein [Deltaproteobacteria bacterium]
MPPIDERTVPRHAAVHRVALRFSGADEYLSAFSANVGKGGMFVHTESPPLPGTSIVLTLGIEGIDDEITLPAVVAHTRADGMGVRFEALTTNQRSAIDRLCKRAEEKVKGAGAASRAPATEVEPKPPDGLLTAGTLVDGRYRVMGHLASGGMGEVYEAEHVYMRRSIALKVLHQEFGNDAEMATRFEREAQIASSLDHPNIVRVFDFGKTQDGKLFLAMELVAGQELEDLLVREGMMPPKRAVALMSQICDAVQDAHNHGIIHRDLKLANVIVTRRREEEIPKVLDFGIARLADDQTAGGKSVTRRGIVVGTPEYLSPEQALGQPIDARADVYSLGIMAYTLLAGRLPFYSDNLRHVVTMQLTQPPPPLGTVAPTLRALPALCAAVLKALEKERDHRFATASAFAEALRAGLEGRALPPAPGPMGAPGASTPAEAAPAPQSLPCNRCGELVLDGERFCAACGTPVAPPCPRCQSPTSPGARFCPSCGLEVSASSSPSRRLETSQALAALRGLGPKGGPTEKTAAALEQLVPYLPARTFEALIDARAQVRGEERRYVTALWIAIGEGKPEARHRSLAAALEVIHEGGGVLYRIGDEGVLVFFGALAAREDDAYRALTAGLEIQRRLKAMPKEDAIDLRIGLHAGVAVPGEVGGEGEGGPDRGTEAIARALAEAAPHGAVNASQPLAEEAGPYLRTQPAPPVAIEGHPEELAVLRLVGLKTPARVNRPQLCGREKEVGAFQRLALATEGGKTKPVVLVGDGGIGKSRLVEELRRFVEGRGWSVATANLVEEERESYAAIGELVLELLRIPGAARHQALREALVKVVKPVGSRAILEQIAGVAPRLVRLRAGAVAAALQALEASVTRERPAMLVFEDLDRLDPGSQEVFRLLCDSHKPVGSLLFATARTEGPERPKSATLYRVPPLGAEASLALVRSILGDAEVPPSLARIPEQAKGNPRALLEQLHLLLDRRVLVEGPKGIFVVQEPRELPSSGRELAKARTQALPADERYLLQVAALLGRSFDGQLLRKALAGLDVATLLTDAQARGLLTHGLGHAQQRFVTDDIRDSLLESIPKAEAAKLHRMLAEALRREASSAGAPVPEGEIARHLARAGDRPGAIQGLVRAAGQELAARNLSSASDLLAEAAREVEAGGHGPGLPSAAECQARAAALAAAAGELERAESLLAKARLLFKAAADPAVRSEVCLADGLVGRARRQPERFRDRVRDAFGAFGGAVPTRRLGLLASQAGAAALAANDPLEAIQMLTEALPATEGDRLAAWFGLTSLDIDALADLGAAHARAGHVEEAAEKLDLALRRARPRRDPALEARILQRLAALAEVAGEWPSAASHHQAAATAAEAAGDLETAARELFSLAKLRHRDGLGQAARACAVRATEICEKIGWEEGTALSRGLFESATGS